MPSDALEALAAFVARHDEATVVVEGHADGRGDERDNLRLSYARARRAARHVRRAGVPDARITVRGLGEFAPLEGTATHDAANRRVIVRVAGPRGCEEGRTW
ncbi:MAG TPA: OmpA family protein [Sandaracinaceae bacterium LLY-WYZ-13_1]|nr:OmpA family protein [Sandaracinaceae bacterium LLY-WYZ-13_1]